ncbi:Hsp20/alpha crystallin family protein [Vitreimonas flagellata]|uniref:Hsp20/alpha crystallin family protein n=1 Tax=Vitreimonas flagellata TaxID=2560861 RepID=UPI001074C6B7|nr:Hsp20/alpha crystallin family protein [Vitreimonas flagellata]
MTDLVPGRRFRAPDRPSDVSPFFALQREMNRLFDDTFNGFGLAPFTREQNSFGFPSVELTETDKELKVTAELAGLDEKDIEINIQDDVLTLRGEKHTETDDKERRYSERFYGRFERRMALPAQVDEDRAKASFKNGVLTVTLPKLETTKPTTKRIQIGK